MAFCCTEHVNKAGLLLISRDYRKRAQSPIEHFQLGVQWRAAVQLGSDSLTRREMQIEHRHYVTWCFPISVSLLRLLAEPLLFSPGRKKDSDFSPKRKYQ